MEKDINEVVDLYSETGDVDKNKIIKILRYNFAYIISFIYIFLLMLLSTVVVLGSFFIPFYLLHLWMTN